MTNIQEIIKKELKKIGLDVAAGLGGSSSEHLEHPKVLANGDYSFFIKDPKIDPKNLPLEKIQHEYIEKVVAAGKFINFYLSRKFFTDSVAEITKNAAKFGSNKNLGGEKIIIEYTDPNPFKEFHIGHLMSNAVGESLSQIIEWSGAKVKRACYQGDVGLHVAKAIWAMKKMSTEMPLGENEKSATSNIAEKITFLGKAYVYGSRSYEEDENFKKQIDLLNKVVYEKTDPEINKLYDWGRKVSLDHLDQIYKKLGTRFDYMFFESEAAPIGLFIVEEYLKKGIFTKSEGATIFKGEDYGLHTRVFVTSQGLPTYETKELGLTKMKFAREDFDTSIVITASEQNDYFKVLLKALEFVNPTAANKTRHVSHGMMRFAEGKMSSRKGNIITGESMINDVESLVQEKIKDRDLTAEEKKQISEVVAIAAIKYSILKQSPGRDIIFDFEKSLSFEGDSGPYLQYAYARAHSILEKARKEGISVPGNNWFSKIFAKKIAPATSTETSEIERTLYRFPEIVDRASREYAPQHITTYLTQIASAFNNFYANNKIVDKEDKNSPYKVALTSAFVAVMQNGLKLLGIKAPVKM
jgi:arginyl-tRNA synthetase